MIKFLWKKQHNEYSPTAESGFIGKDGIDMLSCLLMDNGGQNYMQTIPWVDEGLVRIGLVKKGVLTFSDWARDSWGIDFTKDMAKIYSLYDNNCSIELKIEQFEEVLSKWRKFLLEGPKDNPDGRSA
jgi:hypothetical protein